MIETGRKAVAAMIEFGWYARAGFIVWIYLSVSAGAHVIVGVIILIIGYPERSLAVLFFVLAFICVILDGKLGFIKQKYDEVASEWNGKMRTAEERRRRLAAEKPAPQPTQEREKVAAGSQDPEPPATRTQSGQAVWQAPKPQQAARSPWQETRPAPPAPPKPKPLEIVQPFIAPPPPEPQKPTPEETKMTEQPDMSVYQPIQWEMSVLGLEAGFNESDLESRYYTLASRTNPTEGGSVVLFKMVQQSYEKIKKWRTGE